MEELYAWKTTTLTQDISVRSAIVSSDEQATLIDRRPMYYKQNYIIQRRLRS